VFLDPQSRQRFHGIQGHATFLFGPNLTKKAPNIGLGRGEHGAIVAQPTPMRDVRVLQGS
jgi:hypothetical protein